MKNTGNLLDLEDSISIDHHSDTKALPMAEFEAKLKEKGTSYHIYHPFHIMMAEGKLTKQQLQGWVANRFYYQIMFKMRYGTVHV